jgi:hypothetical protein
LPGSIHVEQDLVDVGVSCLVMVAQYYHGPQDQEFVDQLL